MCRISGIVIEHGKDDFKDEVYELLEEWSD